jgi:hypothetical protein
MAEHWQHNRYKFDAKDILDEGKAKINGNAERGLATKKAAKKQLDRMDRFCRIEASRINGYTIDPNTRKRNAPLR